MCITRNVTIVALSFIALLTCCFLKFLWLASSTATCKRKWYYVACETSPAAAYADGTRDVQIGTSVWHKNSFGDASSTYKPMIWVWM